MKNKVKFSTFSVVLTIGIMIIIPVGIISLIGNTDKLILFCIIMGCGTIAGLYYCPKSVEASDSGIIFNRLISRPKEFPYTSIKSVETCYPSGGRIRLCGSGGFFGYWGYFNDIMIGTYFGYYGNRSNCFLVELKNGKKYVLGCENPVEIVNYINSKI